MAWLIYSLNEFENFWNIISKDYMRLIKLVYFYGISCFTYISNLKCLWKIIGVFNHYKTWDKDREPILNLLVNVFSVNNSFQGKISIKFKSFFLKWQQSYLNLEYFYTRWNRFNKFNNSILMFYSIFLTFSLFK